TVAGMDIFHQEFEFPRQGRNSSLFSKQRLQKLQLYWKASALPMKLGKGMPECGSEIVGYGESSAHPGGHCTLFAGCRAHNRLNILYAHQFEQPARKPKGISRLKP